MKKILFSILTYFLPDKMIRTLFISSIYNKIFNKKVLDYELQHKLNELLHVCSNDEAMCLGNKLSSSFWDSEKLDVIDLEVNEKGDYILSNKAKEDLITEIIANTPSWLLYDTKAMREDLKLMIDNRFKLVHS